jgi:hypothetical protein
MPAPVSATLKCRSVRESAPLSVRGLLAHAQLHAAARGELDRVVGEVDQDLPQPQRIAIEALRQPWGNFSRQLDAFLRCTQAEGLSIAAIVSREVEVDRLQLQLARLDLWRSRGSD